MYHSSKEINDFYTVLAQYFRRQRRIHCNALVSNLTQMHDGTGVHFNTLTFHQFKIDYTTVCSHSHGPRCCFEVISRSIGVEILPTCILYKYLSAHV